VEILELDQLPEKVAAGTAAGLFSRVGIELGGLFSFSLTPRTESNRLAVFMACS
jgi:hypothetical protein